jgi:hypothetical protein
MILIFQSERTNDLAEDTEGYITLHNIEVSLESLRGSIDYASPIGSNRYVIPEEMSSRFEIPRDK